VRLAGLQLSLGSLTLFSENMTAGRGWIAVAAVMLGRARPLLVAAACALFGFSDAVGLACRAGIAQPDYRFGPLCRDLAGADRSGMSSDSKSCRNPHRRPRRNHEHEVGVEMIIADHPLHRSGQAALPHPAPPWVMTRSAGTDRGGRCERTEARWRSGAPCVAKAK